MASVHVASHHMVAIRTPVKDPISQGPHRRLARARRTTTGTGTLQNVPRKTRGRERTERPRRDSNPRYRRERAVRLAPTRCYLAALGRRRGWCAAPVPVAVAA